MLASTTALGACFANIRFASIATPARCQNAQRHEARNQNEHATRKHPSFSNLDEESTVYTRRHKGEGRMSIKPVAWHTEDHQEDKSATTYEENVALGWEMKGWPVIPMYYAIPDTHRVVPVETLQRWRSGLVSGNQAYCLVPPAEIQAIIEDKPEAKPEN